MFVLGELKMIPMFDHQTLTHGNKNKNVAICSKLIIIFESFRPYEPNQILEIVQPDRR